VYETMCGVVVVVKMEIDLMHIIEKILRQTIVSKFCDSVGYISC
jgi:hypothetical protein